MFILSEISDLVQVKPEYFDIDLKKALIREINNKYANKVIPNLGLGVTVWDLLDVQNGLLRPSDGSVYYKVVMRLVVFKPFVGEVLIGWIDSSTEQGIKVKTDFFDEIFIPKDMLFEGCYWKPHENLWVWRTDPEDSESDVYFDINEKIQFRVEEEIFTNIKPTGPLLEEEDEEEDEEIAKKKEQEKAATPPPYAVIASCQNEGMGAISWWS